MYYRLKENCVLVAGKARGAIYDLDSGKVHSINRGAWELLNACREAAFENIIDVRATDNNRYLAFLDKLTAKNLGGFYSLDPGIATTRTLPYPTVKLECLWLELTSICNNKCLHCYSASSPQVDAGSMPHKRWLEVISEARLEGASGLQLIGGEPLMYPHWRELVLKARQENYELIEIFTNATLVDDSCISFFKEHSVSVATTIYANNAEVHDRVTLHPGSYNKTMAAIRKVLDAGIPLRVASIIMKANEHEVENIMKLCEELGVEAALPDVVRPTGRGDDHDLLPTTYTKPPIKPPFYTDPENFAKTHCYHSCLAGRLAITATGDVLPCIFARNQVCGNLMTSSLKDVINGQSLQQCWHTTKDLVEKCQDCEYRYACADCRPLAQGTDPEKRWLAAVADCSYNPYTGIWEDEK